MPKNKRWALKQSLDAANNNLDWAYKHVTRVQEEIEGQHPGTTGELQTIQNAIASIWKAIQLYRDQI